MLYYYRLIVTQFNDKLNTKLYSISPCVNRRVPKDVIILIILLMTYQKFVKDLNYIHLNIYTDNTLLIIHAYIHE